MDLPEIGTIEAFAMIVDVNGFTQIFSRSRQNDGVAQFVRDIPIGGTEITEKHGGLVS